MSTLPVVLPFPLSEGGSGLPESAYIDDGSGYDFALAGVPWVSAVDGDHPLRRKSLPVEKDRQDTQVEPGEQTFSTWWTKAQSSFHAGAGLVYTDQSSRLLDRFRFSDSFGIDPWTAGDVSLVKASPKVKASTATVPRVSVLENGSIIYTNTNTSLKITTETVTPDVNGVDQPAYTAGTAVAAWGSPGTIQSLVNDGTNYYVYDGAAVLKGVVATPGVVPTKIYTVVAGGSGVLGWVKQRLVLAVQDTNGAVVYELDANAAAASPLPSPKFTHPNAAWLWTSIVEGPEAIYVSGHSGSSSSIYKFVLDLDGGMPTLAEGSVAVDLPLGELVLGTACYMGALIGVATNKGFRLGAFDGSNVQLGPRTVEQAFTGDVVAWDRFMFAATNVGDDGLAGFVRVDCSLPLTDRPYQFIPENIFAYANDAVAEDTGVYVTGDVTSATMLNGRLVFASGTGVFVQHPSQLIAEGWMRTARIRFNTLEPKMVRFVRTRTDGVAGDLRVAIGRASDESFLSLTVLDTSTQTDSGDVGLREAPMAWSSLLFSLSRDGTRTDHGPVLSGYQLKALPSVKKQRVMQIPFLCSENETSRDGNELPSRPVLLRVAALEALEESSEAVLFQVLSSHSDQQFSELMTVEDVDFVQVEGPFDRTTTAGVCMVSLRTVR